MTAHFWDTSALVKRYFAEIGSERVATLLADDEASHVASRLTLAEVPSAIVRRVQDAQVASVLLTQFDRDIAMLFSLSEFDNALVDEATALVRKHSLRGCDSLQLAAALRIFADISSLVFVSADGELNAAATSEGLLVVNPNEEMSEE